MSETIIPDFEQTPKAAEEDMSFVRNFNDVFLAIGLGVLSFGLWLVTTLFTIPTGNAYLTGAGFLACAAAMWMLAEIFARKRRLFLPSLVLLLAFAGFVLQGTTALYIGANVPGVNDLDVYSTDALWEKARSAPLVIFGIQTIAIFAYYFRMRLAFAIGLGALMLGLTAAYTFHSSQDQGFSNLNFMTSLAIGIFMFFLGMYYDAKDPARETRFADNGFWLHLFAAPLIFYSTLSMAVGNTSDVGTTNLAAITTLGLVLLFAFVSLLINRRALLVSGLLAAAIAIGSLVTEAGLDDTWTLALTLILLGGSMVLLGGGWHAIRRVVIAPFPKTGPIARIIPPQTIGA